MSDTKLALAQPATIVPLRRLSALWLIPLVTLVVGAWMLYDNWASQGPLITIEFPSAAGLEAGNTRIRTLDVDVGQVEQITLNDAVDGVIISARINDEFRDLLSADSRFWVVKPTVSLAGVSGLGTLLTGQYIHFAPGSAPELAGRFTGLEQPPVTPPGTPGLHLNLMTDSDYSFAKGDPIHYQGIRVGTIEDVELNMMEQQIYYDAFIEAPYHQLITPDTRFWKASGVHAEVTSQGFVLDTGNLNSILFGGVSFTTPEGQLGNSSVADDTLFYVYSGRSAINERQYMHAVRYWVLVKDSIAGLQVDAPVNYRGVQVGRVLSTDYIGDGRRNLLDRTVNIPVLIEINPGRLGLPDTEQSLATATADINTWISQGLTATLKSQNLLLGLEMIELEYNENATGTELSYFQELPVIPTGQNTIAKFTRSMEELLARVNELPVEDLLTKLNLVLDEGATTLTSIQKLAASGESLFNSEGNIELVEQLTVTLDSFDTLAQSFSEESRTNQEIRTLLTSMSSLVEEFKPLLTELKNKPNALIFSTSQQQELIPMRKEP